MGSPIKKPPIKPLGSKPIRLQKLNEVVASRIKDYIIEHSLGEGDRLPTEQQMTEMFGVSRVSIREATKALSFLGIIHSAPRRGLTVGQVDMDRVAEYLGFHFALNDYPRQQLYKTRSIIEIGILGEAMERISGNPAVYQKLSAVNDKLKTAADEDEFIACDLAFHRALIESSDIEPLTAFNSLLEVFFKRFRDQIFKSRFARTNAVASHKQIINALRARDLEKAQDLLRSHLLAYKGIQ
jgi:GntR family transcriptional regulator, transcriptional repressor for pyruvate dehydrogenase complex